MTTYVVMHELGWAGREGVGGRDKPDHDGVM
jgi:hypothetical protein